MKTLEGSFKLTCVLTALHGLAAVENV